MGRYDHVACCFFSLADSGLSVSGDINAFNINPVLVEESIPITSCPHPTSKHTTGTGISDSGSTSSHRATSNTEQSQQGASRERCKIFSSFLPKFILVLFV